MCAAIHHHDLALGGVQICHGTLVTPVTVGTEPFAHVQVVSTPVAGQGINRGWAKGVRTANQHVAGATSELGADAFGLGVIAFPVVLDYFATRSAGGVAGRVEDLRSSAFMAVRPYTPAAASE